MMKSEQWEMIPLRDFPHLYIIRNQGGEVIATVHNQYAQTVQALPELYSVTNDLYQVLSERYQDWHEESCLGRLHRIINKLKQQLEEAKQNA